MAEITSQRLLPCSGGTMHADKVENQLINSHLKEIEEVRQLIQSMKFVWNDLRKCEMDCERFTCIVDGYQEQPQVFDPYIEEIFTSLINIAVDSGSPAALSHLAFKFMYLVTKMRGFKMVVKYLPHQVSDMVPVLGLIARQDVTDIQTWPTRYMLLLWLSMVIMIPFDLKKLDGHHATSGSSPSDLPVIEKVFCICQAYLSVGDKCRDAAVFLTARFLSRPDSREKYLPLAVDWSLREIASAQRVGNFQGANIIIACLSTLALLFKSCRRENMLQYASPVFSTVVTCSLMDSDSSLLRKTAIKLIQRVGLCFLPNRVASWRYQRGCRLLSDNLKMDNACSLPPPSQHLPPDPVAGGDGDDEDIDVPEDVEEVVGILLVSLKDRDTVVRWSAAKGVGRVTGRLSKRLADEVLLSVLGVFSWQETDAAWQGGCLTLAELGRRGLLLPVRLKEVVPVVLKALQYDEKVGASSVGSQVRDAACYVCWAFARAYQPQEIDPYVGKIASALVIVSIFDREVNVRRAASAAFQENVGRQGTLPHGIEICTTVDYLAVGNMNTCYLHHSLYMAGFEEYTVPLIDHLLMVRVGHWDSNIRLLSSQALHQLTLVAADHILTSVLPPLCDMVMEADLFRRHGSILALAEVTYGLYLFYQQQGRLLFNVLGAKLLMKLQETAAVVVRLLCHGDHSRDLMLRAACHLIHKCSLSHLPFSSDVLEQWQSLLEHCLGKSAADVRMSAVEALPSFMSQYHGNTGRTIQLAECREALLKRYVTHLTSSNEAVRQGFILALGCMPQFMLLGSVQLVVDALCAIVNCDSKLSKKMADARRDAVTAVTRVVQTVGVQEVGVGGDGRDVLCCPSIRQIFATLLTALNDYTTDSRGDVGSWVREAAMTALLDVVTVINTSLVPSCLEPQLVQSVLCGIVQQACEKIDRTRCVAGRTLFHFLHTLRPPLLHVPCREMLECVIPRSLGSTDWANPAVTFPIFSRLLKEPTFCHSVLLGMTISVGGLTESLVRHSSACLLSYIREQQQDEKAMVMLTECLLNIFRQHLHVDRVSMPMLKMWDLLLGGRCCFDGLPDSVLRHLPGELLDLVRQEVAHSCNPHKYIAAADVLCGLLQFSSVCQKTLSQLSVLLCHRYPIVRRTSASRLYEAFLTYGDDLISPGNMNTVLSILSDTKWEENVQSLIPVRNSLCHLLGIPHPVSVIKLGHAMLHLTDFMPGTDHIPQSRYDVAVVMVKDEGVRKDAENSTTG